MNQLVRESSRKYKITIAAAILGSSLYVGMGQQAHALDEHGCANDSSYTFKYGNSATKCDDKEKLQELKRAQEEQKENEKEILKHEVPELSPASTWYEKVWTFFTNLYMKVVTYFS